MADFSVRVEGLDRFEDWIRKAEEHVKNSRKLMDIIGGRVVNEAVFDHFKKKESPDGEKWKDLTPDYAARKMASKGTLDILIGKGNMRDAVNRFVRGDHTVEVGVNDENVPYAAAQNFGFPKRNLPARQFIGIGKREEEVINRTVLDWIGGAL